MKMRDANLSYTVDRDGDVSFWMDSFDRNDHAADSTLFACASSYADDTAKVYTDCGTSYVISNGELSTVSAKVQDCNKISLNGTTYNLSTTVDRMDILENKLNALMGANVNRKTNKLRDSLKTLKMGFQ